MTVGVEAINIAFFASTISFFFFFTPVLFLLKISNIFNIKTLTLLFNLVQ